MYFDARCTTFGFDCSREVTVYSLQCSVIVIHRGKRYFDALLPFPVYEVLYLFTRTTQIPSCFSLALSTKQDSFNNVLPFGLKRFFEVIAKGPVSVYGKATRFCRRGNGGARTWGPRKCGSERGITRGALRGSSLGFLVAGSRTSSVNPSRERCVRPRLIVNRALDSLRQRDDAIELEEENAVIPFHAFLHTANTFSPNRVFAVFFFSVTRYSYRISMHV